MAFDWKEFLTLAEYLMEERDSRVSRECLQRAAVSRAYYAVFCTIRDRLARGADFTRTGTASDHAAVVEYLRQHGHSTAAIWLSRLRQWRNQCDYDNDVTNLPVLANDALGYARSLVEASVQW